MMGRAGKLQSLEFKNDGVLSNPNLGLQWNLPNSNVYPGGGLFASVSQMGNNENGGFKLPCADLLAKYVSLPEGFKISGMTEEENGVLNKKKKGGLKLKVKVSDPSLRRLISGGIAGAISRTAVAPLETIRTHLMVGSSGHSTGEVFQNIMNTEGWKGLFRGNLVNVIRVAPSKAIEVVHLLSMMLCVKELKPIGYCLMVGSSGHSTGEVFQNIMNTEGWKGLFRVNLVNVIRVAPSKAVELFAYDTVNKNLSPKPGEQSKMPIPPSLIAGACAGVSSTLVTYPLELVKTRLTIQRGVYDGMLDAFVKILQEGGIGELYRGLTPSLIGVIPYAATNYCAYDTLRKIYRRLFKQERIGNIETLLIGSAAGAISSSATFPLEVARKHMQVGAVSGRQVYRNVLHALASIVEREGINGLYKGLGPSCLKLVPAAGISFMCYEACKRILVEREDDE